MTLTITTQSGKIYKVNSDQQIIRTDMSLRPTDEWLFAGILPTNTTRLKRVVNYQSLKVSLPTALKYKNGKPRYNVVDVDHGTIRVWSDGITNLQWSEQ